MDELADANLTPLPTHPGIEYVARVLAAISPQNLGTQNTQHTASPGQILEIWQPEFGNLESKIISKIKVLNIEIHVAQNVGKVWIRQKKYHPGPIWCHSRYLFHGPEKSKKLLIFAYFCLFSRCGALAAIHPGWGNR